MKEIITRIKIDDEGNVVETSTEIKEDVKKEEPEYRYSQYTRWFDQDCFPVFRYDDHEHNLNTLFRIQNICNERLIRDKKLYLNDVYRMLGIETNDDEECIGWTYGILPNSDNCVDFGIMNPRNYEFITGIEKKVLLEFNVDGDITHV